MTTLPEVELNAIVQRPTATTRPLIEARAQGGLGIGLALVRHLVALHQGGVTAESDGPGQGSEFVVRLPLAVPRVLLECPAELTAPPT
ncbi:MAG TPA: ATP-binding protein [Pirellulales bacterium]